MPPNIDSPTEACPICGTLKATDDELCAGCLIAGVLEPEPHADDEDSLGGTKVGDFELLAEIARGGMGVVYRAHQKGLNREVAVKMILGGQLASRATVDRFLREAEAAARLDHPHIVPIYEIVEEEGQHFYVMKLIHGADLAQRMEQFHLGPRQGKPIKGTDSFRSQKQVAGLMEKIADALAFAHQHGVLHRDLKPTNILIDAEGEPHLTDFGLAKILDDEAGGLTRSGSLLGSPHYMAPEQTDGSTSNVTMAADVYGLGAILYELMTGRPPFEGKSTVEVIRKVADREVERPRKIAPYLSKDLETICLKCLTKHPSGRYTSAQEVREELQRFQKGQPVLARSVGNLERLWRWGWRNPALAGLSLILLLAIIVGVGGVVWQNRIAVAEAKRANQSVTRLRWERVGYLLEKNEPRNALAQLAQILRDDPENWRAAMYALTALQEYPLAIPKQTLPKPSKDATGWTAAFLPDGKSVALGYSGPHQVRIWNQDSPNESWQAMNHESLCPYYLEVAGDWVLVSGIGAQLWNTRTQKAASPVLFERESCVGKLHPDGSRFYVASYGMLHGWATDSDRPLFESVSCEIAAQAVACSPDGNHIMVAGNKDGHGAAVICDAASGQRVGQIRSVVPEFADASFSGDGRHIATVSTRGGFELWDAQTFERISGPLDTGRPLRRAVFSPDGSLLASQPTRQEVKVWDVRTETVRFECRHQDNINNLTFAPDGLRLATNGIDGAAIIWDSFTGRQLGEPLQHGVPIYALAWNPEDCSLVTSGNWGYAHEWDLSSHLPIQIPAKATLIQSELVSVANDHPGHNEQCPIYDLNVNFGTDSRSVRVRNDLVLAPLGTAYASGVHHGSLRLVVSSASSDEVIDMASSATISRRERKAAILALAMSSDGMIVGSVDKALLLTLWNAETGQVIHEQQRDPEHPVTGLEFSPNGDLLAVATKDRAPQVIDVNTGEIVGSATGDPLATECLRFSEDGSRVYCYGNTPYVRTWDTTLQTDLVDPIFHEGVVLDVAFSPDDSLLATASKNGTIRVWETATGRSASPILEHGSEVFGVTFSPDGKRLGAVSLEGVRVWDYRRGEPLTPLLENPIATPEDYPFYRGRIRFSPDGHWIAASNLDGVRLWDVATPPAEAVPEWFPRVIEALAGRKLSDENQVDYYSFDDWHALRSELIGKGIPTEKGYYARWLSWFLQDKTDKTLVSPHSALTRAELFDRLLEENSISGLSRALQMRPNNALVHVSLAEQLVDEKKDRHVCLSRAKWHCKRALELAEGDEGIRARCQALEARLASEER